MDKVSRQLLAEALEKATLEFRDQVDAWTKHANDDDLALVDKHTIKQLETSVRKLAAALKKAGSDLTYHSDIAEEQADWNLDGDEFF